MKQRIRFNGELVIRNMCWFQGDGSFYIFSGEFSRLFGQTKHQIQIEIIKPRLMGNFGCSNGLLSIMNPA